MTAADRAIAIFYIRDAIIAQLHEPDLRTVSEGMVRRPSASAVLEIENTTRHYG